MKSNITQKSVTLKTSKKSYGLYGLAVFLLVQLALIACFVPYFTTMRRDVTRSDAALVGRLVIDAVDNLSRPVPMDAKTGTVYLYETRITLPANRDRLLPLRYNYQPAAAGMPEQLNLIDPIALQTAKAGIYTAQDHQAVFAAVPRLQACARGYHVTFTPVKEIGNLIIQKQLQDGRQAYLYHEAACPESADLTAYLKKLDSY